LVKILMNGEEVGSVQFPITEAGTTSAASFMINNDTESSVELSFWSEDGEVTAESYPKHLDPHESKPAKLLFSPSKDRPDELNTRWGFRELIGR